MALSEAQLSAIVGFAGALIGAWVAWWATVSVARWSRTMDLHREFNSERLSLARSAGFAFLKANWGKSFTEVAESDDLEMVSVPLWEVIYFYERLWTLIRHRQIVGRVVPELFGELFLWWYIVSFRQQLLPTKWKSAKDVEALFNWMKKQTSPAQWSQWIDQQEAQYDVLKRRHSPVQKLGTNETSL